MFQLSKITLFLQKADELTGIRDCPNQGVRWKGPRGKLGCIPKRRLWNNAIPFSQRPAWRCDVQISSTLLQCLHRQSLASSSVRLRLNLPQVLGCAFKTRNRTLSHRKLFHQASPGCQTRSLFLFSALHSAQSIIQWLPSLFFLCPSQSDFVLFRLVVGLCLVQRVLTWARDMMVAVMLIIIFLRKEIANAFVSCSPALVLPDPCSEDRTLPLCLLLLWFALPSPSPTADCTLTDYFLFRGCKPQFLLSLH